MLRHITFTVFITTSMNTLATGMVPETSVLLVDEKRGWICPYISRHLLSLNPLQARCRRYSRGER